jgi:predicted RNA-binding protein with PIN domain
LHLDDPHDEEKLLARLRTYRARTGQRLVVYFDPGIVYQPSAHDSKGGITTRQAGTGRSADNLIARDIRRHRNPRELTVVTSDRAIQEMAQQNGARVIDSETFAAQLSPLYRSDNPRADQPLSEEEVQEWLAIFGQPE